MKSKQIIPIVCLLSTAVMHAQLMSFGVKGGVVATTPTENLSDESRRYVVGPVFEMRWGRIALEVNLLYKRTGGSQSFLSLLSGRNLLVGESYTLVPSRRMRNHTWELPVLGKYYFRRESKLQPFLATGYAFRKSRTYEEATVVLVDQGKATMRTDTAKRWSDLNIGAVAAGGVQWKWNRFAFTPEIRYSRWGRDRETQQNRNQVDLLFGITF